MDTERHSSCSEQLDIRVGARIRHARLLRNLKLRELADLVKCSEGYISKLENNRANPSLAMLHLLARALDMNVASLFSDDLTHNGQVTVLREDERPALRASPTRKGPGITLYRLVPSMRGALLQANIHAIEPGGCTEGQISHDGEEMGYVLEGVLDLEVDGRHYRLEAGTSFFFNSTLPHGYRNTGDRTTRVLWVNTPPTF